MSLYLLFTITIIIYVIYYYFTRTHKYWKYKNVKGPKPIPVFGNYRDVAFRRKAKFMFYSEIYKQFPEEKIVGVYEMTTPTLLVRDLDIVKQILIKDFEVFSDRGVHYSKKGFGQNIIHCDVDTWRVLRNQFTVLYTPSKIKNIFHLLDERGDRYVNYVKSVTTKQPEQDVFKLTFKYGVSTTIATTYGWDIDTFNEKTGWYTILDDHFVHTYWEEIGLLFPSLMTKFNLSILTKKTRDICHELLKAILNQEPASFETNTFNVRNVILNLKKKSENKELNNERNPSVEITDDLLASQLWVFQMAGYLSNLLTMTYALYELACNPNIQDTLRDEVDEVMNKCGGKLTYELLNEMSYLKMVFEETLRLHPSSHIISRNVAQDVKLDGTDVIIEKGTSVIISSHAIQHDENYYPEPDKFKPERFSPDNAKYHYPCTFLSFGAGRRNCFAGHYSRLQFGVAITKLLYHFRVETSSKTCSNLTYDPYHMLIKPEPGVILKFVPREKSSN